MENLPEARNWGGCWSGPGPRCVLALKYWGRAISESQRVKGRTTQKCSSILPPPVASEKFPQALLSGKQCIQTGGRGDKWERRELWELGCRWAVGEK